MGLSGRLCVQAATQMTGRLGYFLSLADFLLMLATAGSPLPQSLPLKILLKSIFLEQTRLLQIAGRLKTIFLGKEISLVCRTQHRLSRGMFLWGSLANVLAAHHCSDLHSSQLGTYMHMQLLCVIHCGVGITFKTSKCNNAFHIFYLVWYAA